MEKNPQGSERKFKFLFYLCRLNYEIDIMQNIPRPIENIKAEAYLTSFLNTCRDVNIEPQGVFSRNYAEDVISVESDVEMNEKLTLSLSRDSLFHILPEGLFFVEYKLRELGKKNDPEKFKLEEERIQKEKKRIRLFFQPFDTTYFRLRFELEKKVNGLAENRTQFILNKLFDAFSFEKEDKDNSLIRKILPLLLFAPEIRGNKHLLKDVLKGVFFPAKVDLFVLKKRQPSGLSETVMKVNVYIKKLSSKQFKDLKKEADVFALFFQEWFVPVDNRLEFKIKDNSERFILGKALTLDYNTYL